MILPSDMADLHKLEEEMEDPVLVPSFCCSRCQKIVSEKLGTISPILCPDCENFLRSSASPSADPHQEPSISAVEAAALRIDFNEAIGKLAQELNSLNSKGQKPLQQGTNALWKEIEHLEDFLQVSTQHLELIATLAELVGSESARDLSWPKANALLAAFQVLSGKFIISEVLLNEVYRILERAGFDVRGTPGFPSD
ncbi:MAG TPA: hypothetical protein VK633_07815 [Verrucomicrobiae bacterium]|nr:hypothetical protein [Verrucomicrobiae bacterium]